MKYEILCIRGNSQYLVRKEEEYYLVNMQTMKFMKDDNPTIFMKWGYFEDVENLSPELAASIESVLEDDTNLIETK